jgi:hypothetical protein
MSHDHRALVAQFRETPTQQRYNAVVGVGSGRHTSCLELGRVLPPNYCQRLPVRANLMLVVSGNWICLNLVGETASGR